MFPSALAVLACGALVVSPEATSATATPEGLNEPGRDRFEWTPLGIGGAIASTTATRIGYERRLTGGHAIGLGAMVKLPIDSARVREAWAGELGYRYAFEGGFSGTWIGGCLRQGLIDSRGRGVLVSDFDPPRPFRRFSLIEAQLEVGQRVALSEHLDLGAKLGAGWAAYPGYHPGGGPSFSAALAVGWTL